MSMQDQILEALHELGGEVTEADGRATKLLADAMGTTPRSMGFGLNRLHAAGLIERDLNDRGWATRIALPPNAKRSSPQRPSENGSASPVQELPASIDLRDPEDEEIDALASALLKKCIAASNLNEENAKKAAEADRVVAALQADREEREARIGKLEAENGKLESELATLTSQLRETQDERDFGKLQIEELEEKLGEETKRVAQAEVNIDKLMEALGRRSGVPIHQRLSEEELAALKVLKAQLAPV